MGKSIGIYREVSMLVQERHDKILENLRVNKVVKVSEIVKEFNVSVETVRRDLEFLEKQGLLKRVYGGAVSANTRSTEPSYFSREVQNLEEKKAIGKKAAQLIEDGDTVLLDLGTTTLEVAKNLKKKHNITVLTNSIKIAVELVDVPDNKIILLGGELRPNELSTSGFLTDMGLHQFCVDKAIIGVGGITVEAGITDYHIQEGKARRLMVDAAEKVIAVTDYSKFGVNAFIHICELKRIETIVTDWKVHPKIIKQLQEQDIQVLIAEK